MAEYIRITDHDNVVVALHPIAKGTAVKVAGKTVTALEDIPQGHKMALEEIKEGGQVLKYGNAIGHATRDIPAGSWVHTHNMATNLSGEVAYTYHPFWKELEKKTPRTFQGYLRNSHEINWLFRPRINNKYPCYFVTYIIYFGQEVYYASQSRDQRIRHKDKYRNDALPQ